MTRFAQFPEGPVGCCLSARGLALASMHMHEVALRNHRAAARSTEIPTR
jgi:hypothetical protein